jgi:hypothetical protein
MPNRHVRATSWTRAGLHYAETDKIHYGARVMATFVVVSQQAEIDYSPPGWSENPGRWTQNEQKATPGPPQKLSKLVQSVEERLSYR